MKITNGFELIRPLDGGRGRVWLARETALQRDVVLKFQSDATDAARAALLREADILARCDHPSIVPFFRALPTAPPSRALYAMKALPNTLRDRLALASGSSLPEAAIRRLGSEIADALAYLHAMSPPVVHGNVNKDNILIDVGGRAVLAGFGSARAVVDGDGEVMAEDILSLGRVLEEALGHVRRHVSGKWRRLLARMMAGNPAERPCAAEVAAKLATSRSRRRCFRLVAATAAVALVAALTTALAPREHEAVVDETISPTLTSTPVLQPALPDFSPGAMRRIPWYCHLNSFDTSIPEIDGYKRRVDAFDDAHPELAGIRRRVFAGMRRTLRLPGGVQLEMVAVPYGVFRRGFFLASNSADRAECAIAPESVYITRPFWMARTELTRAQYAAVMRRAPAVAGHSARRLMPWEGMRGRPLKIEGGDLPVGEDLDLADVMRFIDALNGLCGLEGEQRFRLPTEAEWEHACRAFTGRHYESEKDPGAAAWMRENSGGTPHPVAQKAQNPFGLFDMHGNLAEWCADAYGLLGEFVPFDPLVEPASNSAPRVVRGGSFRDDCAACDSNVRAAARPTDKGYAIRLVALP